MNCNGTRCLICLYILSTAFSVKIHLFSGFGNFFLPVPRTVIKWETSLVSTLLKVKGLVRMNKSDYFLPCCSWSYYISIEHTQDATILICCILNTRYTYLVGYLKEKTIRLSVVTDRVTWSHLFQSYYVRTKACERCTQINFKKGRKHMSTNGSLVQQVQNTHHIRFKP